MPGAHLFPGGAVDKADRLPRAAGICDGRSEEEASAVLGVASGGLSWWVAGLRECFEEAGILLASKVLPAAVLERLRHRRREIEVAPGAFVDACRRERVTLAAGSVHPLSHWVTPLGAPRRYDTWFFVAWCPPDQEPAPDGREIVEAAWFSPADSLAKHAAGELDLLLPTVENLKQLCAFPSTPALLAWAAQPRVIEPICPRVHHTPGGPEIVLPGEPGYMEASEYEPLPAGLPLPGRPGSLRPG